MLRSAQIAMVALATLLFCSNAKSAPEPEPEAPHGNVACERPDTAHPLTARWHLHLAGNGAAYLELQMPPSTALAVNQGGYTEQFTQLLERRAPQYSISF